MIFAFVVGLHPLGGIVSDLDRRRYQRFRYDGTAMLIYDDFASRRVMVISTYLNLSQGGACVMPPESSLLRPGAHLYILPEQYRRKREAVVVDFSDGLLHLELAALHQMSEFEIAMLARQYDLRLPG